MSCSFGLSGLSGFWLNETNQMNQRNQIDGLVPHVRTIEFPPYTIVFPQPDWNAPVPPNRQPLVLIERMLAQMGRGEAWGQ